MGNARLNILRTFFLLLVEYLDISAPAPYFFFLVTVRRGHARIGLVR